MKNLILKDLKLSVHPTTAIYAVIPGGLMFVPAYPRSMAFLYSVIGVFVIFQCDLQNHDRTFCCLLPVTKKQIVKSRVLSVILIQLGLMLISIPCAVAARTILKNTSNPAGMNANAIMYAIVLIGYAVLPDPLIVAAHNVSVFVLADFSVQHKCAVVSAVKRNSIFFKRQNGTFKRNLVSARHKQRQHARSRNR